MHPNSHKNFTYNQRQLKIKGKIVVGNDDVIQAHILNLLHASRLGGNSGIHTTYQKIPFILYWKGLWKIGRASCRERVLNLV